MSRKSEFYRNLPRMTETLLETLIDLLDHLERRERLFVFQPISCEWRIVE